MNIAVIGKKGVGKTSLINRIIYNKFSIIYKPTLLTEYYETDLGLTFWDIKQKPKQNMDIIILVTKDIDYSMLENYLPLPTWVAIVENNIKIPFCASHRVFNISNMSNSGIDKLFKSILEHYISNHTFH